MDRSRSCRAGCWTVTVIPDATSNDGDVPKQHLVQITGLDLSEDCEPFDVRPFADSAP